MLTVGDPVWVTYGERRYAGIYAGRCGMGGIRHLVLNVGSRSKSGKEKPGGGRWCVEREQITRRAA